MLSALLAASMPGLAAAELPKVDEPTGALHRAARSGAAGEIVRLIDGGAAVDATDRYEWTALHWAALADRPAAARALLDRGADPNARGLYDMTPLHWACMAGSDEVVSLLVRRGSRTDRRNLYGMTPLFEAADEKVVHLLVDAGAQVGAVDDRGLMALHVARSKRVALAMMDRGANLFARSRDGRSILDMLVLVPLENEGLMVYASNRAARLRGDRGSYEVTIRNVWPRSLPDLTFDASSEAASVHVAPGRIAAFAPGQLTALAFALERRPAVPEGEHAIRVDVAAAGARLGSFTLTVDTSRTETWADRGMVRLLSGTVRPEGSKLAYAAYLAAPLIVVGLWVWRRRR